MNRLKMLKVY